MINHLRMLTEYRRSFFVRKARPLLRNPLVFMGKINLNQLNIDKQLLIYKELMLIKKYCIMLIFAGDKSKEAKQSKWLLDLNSNFTKHLLCCKIFCRIGQNILIH